MQGFLYSKGKGGVINVHKGEKWDAFILMKNNEGVEKNLLLWWSVPDKAELVSILTHHLQHQHFFIRVGGVPGREQSRGIPSESGLWSCSALLWQVKSPLG